MHFALLHFLLFRVISNLDALFILQGLNNLAALIVADHAHLEEEVKERPRLCDLAKQGFEKWKASKAKLDALVKEKKNLKGRLEQLEGQDHSLQGDVETCDRKLIKLRDDVHLA